MSKPKITTDDLCRAAKRVGCSTAEIQTFLEVETKGKGFDDQDRPLILFERHIFHKLTNGTFDVSHPNISNKTPGGYGSSASQYDRFSAAFTLSPQAAMMSASWGLGQVLGRNFEEAGYKSVGGFVDAMKVSEGKQLDAAIEFIIHNHLDDELRNHNWAAFARGYNGPEYRKNDYDTNLATAFAKFSKHKIDCNQDSALPLPATATVVPAESPRVNAIPLITEAPTIPGEANAAKLEAPKPAADVIAVAQTKPADTTADSSLVSKVKSIYLAAPAAAGAFLTGIGTWLSGARLEITLGFFGASALIAMTWISWNYWIKNQRERRNTELVQRREEQAFELTKLQMESAMRKELNTIQLVPPVAETSDPTK